MSKEHNGDTDGHTLPEKVRGIIIRELDDRKVKQEQRWTGVTRAASSKLNKEILTNINAHGLVLASSLVPMAVYGEIVTAATKATKKWPRIVWKTIVSILDEAHVELRDRTQLNALVDEYAWAVKQEPFTLGHIDPDRFKDFVRLSTSRYGGIHQYVWDDFERSMQSRAGLAQLGIINTARRERGAIWD